MFVKFWYFGQTCPDACDCYVHSQRLWCDYLTEIPFPHSGLIDLYFNRCQFSSILDLAFWTEAKNISFFQSVTPCYEIFNLTQFHIYSDICFLTTHIWSDLTEKTTSTFKKDNTSGSESFTSKTFILSTTEIKNFTTGILLIFQL
jgi:hypothetical protein